jgi:hypothetical protein
MARLSGWRRRRRAARSGRVVRPQQRRDLPVAHGAHELQRLGAAASNGDAVQRAALGVAQPALRDRAADLGARLGLVLLEVFSRPPTSSSARGAMKPWRSVVVIVPRASATRTVASSMK